MNADDDGFVEHFTIMRMTESKPDDLKVLQAKEFVMVFDEKVLVVLDWKENNFIRSDRYTPSRYLKEYEKEIKMLSEKGLADVGIPKVNQRLPQVRLGKVRKGKNNIYICSFETFWKQYPKKVAKKKVEQKYNQLATSKQKEEEILQGLKSYTEKWRIEKTNLTYIPNPLTWLNQERWNDDVQINRDVFNKFAREQEQIHEQRKQEEKRIYSEYKVDDGRGGMISLSEILKNGMNGAKNSA